MTDNWESFYGTGYTVSTCDIPYGARMPTIWYGVDLPFEHTAETIVRILKFCDNCDSLQIKGRNSCPECGVLYKKKL